MIIMLGMAGSGKSTQCRLLEDGGLFQWISVGEVLRRAHDGSQLEQMKSGKVLPDEVIMPIVEGELQKRPKTPEVLLDGCPRTIGQARWLADQKIFPVRVVIHLVFNEKEAEKRLELRHRSDDKPQAIEERINAYFEDINPILEIFTTKGIRVSTVDASSDIDTVHRSILETLGEA